MKGLTMSHILAGFCLLAANCTSADPSQAVFPYAYQTHTLPNGLSAIMIPMDSPGLAAYYSVVRTGSRDEVEPGKTGFAHFFEHMMFRGTKKYPQSVYNDIVTSIGAKANAFTTDDLTAYHLTFAKEDLEKVIDIESDRFQNLSYEKPAFQTEAGAIYGEYLKGVTQPFFLLEEKLQDTAYDVHTYKHTTMGFEADIKAMPEAYDYSLTFFQHYYRPENVILLIAGDIDPKATAALVDKYYGSWKPGYVAPRVPLEPIHTKERTATVSYPGKTLPILAVAYQGDAFDPANRDYMAAMLLADLAFSESSDIYRKLVIDEQKVEMIQADVPRNRNMPLFGIYAMVKKAEDIDYVRDQIYHTLEGLKTKPVDEKRLGEVKRRNKYSFLMELDTPDHVAGGLARMVALTGGIAAIDQLYSESDKITQRDITAAAKKYFETNRRTVVVLKGAQ
jgi:zinc protease